MNDLLWFSIPIAGFAVGVFTATTGSGGGVLLTLYLALLFALPYPTAISCTLVNMGVTAIVATYHHNRLGNVDWWALRRFLIGSIPGSAAGRLLLLSVTSSSGALSDLRHLFTGLYGLFLLGGVVGFAHKAIRGGGRKPGPPLWIGRAGIKLLTESKSPLLIATGAAAGMLGGLLSIGGGIIAVPALVLGLGVPYAMAVATSTAQLVAVSLAASLASVGSGNIQGEIMGLLLVGSVPGAILGTRALGRAAAVHSTETGEKERGQ